MAGNCAVLWSGFIAPARLLWLLFIAIFHLQWMGCFHSTACFTGEGKFILPLLRLPVLPLKWTRIYLHGTQIVFFTFTPRVHYYYSEYDRIANSVHITFAAYSGWILFLNQACFPNIAFSTWDMPTLVRFFYIYVNVAFGKLKFYRRPFTVAVSYSEILSYVATLSHALPHKA